MGDTYRPPEKRRRSDSPPNNDNFRYRSFKDVQRYTSADRPSGSRSSSQGYDRDAISKDRSHSPRGPSRRHVASTITTANTTTANGVDEVVRKFVQAIRNSSAASARHDLALQRAESARKEHDNMQSRFASYPAIAEQKRNNVEIAKKEVRDTEASLEINEYALSKALHGIITTANDQTKPASSTSLSSLEQERALRNSYETVVSELEETRSRCNRLEKEVETLHRSTEKHNHNQKFISEDVATLQKNSQGHTAEIERQKAAVDRLNISRRESPEQNTAQAKISTTLQELSGRLNDLETQNKESNMNMNNEFIKQSKSLELLSSTVTEKLDASSTTSLPDPVIQREIDIIKSTIQVLQKQTDNQENKVALTALKQRVSVVENDALPNLEALGQRVLAIENGTLPKLQALEPRISTIESGTLSKAQSQAMQRDIETIKTTIQEFKEQEGTENKAAIDTIGRRLSAIEDDALSKIQASTTQNELDAIKTSLQELQELKRQLDNKENKTEIATLWQHLLAVENLASPIEAIKAEIQELKRESSPGRKDENKTTRRALREQSSAVETHAIQSLEQRLSTLEENVSSLGPNIEQRFKDLDAFSVEKDDIYDSFISGLQEQLNELRENSDSTSREIQIQLDELRDNPNPSIRELQENIGPIHAAIKDIQERIGPIHAAIKENRDSFAPIHEAIEQMRESLTTIQEAVKQLEKRPPTTPIIPSNATTANVTTNGHVSSPIADGAYSGRSLDQQKLDTLGYAVGDLERRFSNIQTDELANQMVDQMKKLYPAPANLQQTVDNVNKKFQSFISKTEQALEARNGDIDAIGTRADDAKAEASAAASRIEECNSNLARLGHEVQELRTALERLVAALPKSKVQDTMISEQALLDVRMSVSNLEKDMQECIFLMQGMATRLDTVGLEKLKADHQALAEKALGLRDEVAGVKEETARLRGALMTVCSGQEMQMATVQGVIDEIGDKVGYHDIEWD